MPLLAAADCPRPQCANAFATQTQQQGRERSRFQCSTLSPPPQFHQHTASQPIPIWSWSSMVDLDRHESQHTHTAEERDVSTRHQHSTRPPPPARFSMRRPAEREVCFCVCVDSGLSSGPSFFLPAVKNYNFSSPMNVCVLSVPARASMSIGHDDASKTKATTVVVGVGGAKRIQCDVVGAAMAHRILLKSRCTLQLLPPGCMQCSRVHPRTQVLPFRNRRILGCRSVIFSLRVVVVNKASD